MNSAVIGVGSDCRECVGEGRADVTYARVEDTIRIIWSSRRHAMIVGRPGPRHDIASPDRNRVGSKSGPALSHAHVSRSRGSEDREEKEKNGEKSDVHFGDVF